MKRRGKREGRAKDAEGDNEEKAKRKRRETKRRAKERKGESKEGRAKDVEGDNAEKTVIMIMARECHLIITVRAAITTSAVGTLWHPRRPDGDPLEGGEGVSKCHTNDKKSK